MNFTARKALGQFVSTFKEWHYFAGGLSLGFAGGLYVGARLVVRLQKDD